MALSIHQARQLSGMEPKPEKSIEKVSSMEPLHGWRLWRVLPHCPRKDKPPLGATEGGQAVYGVYTGLAPWGWVRAGVWTPRQRAQAKCVQDGNVFTWVPTLNWNVGYPPTQQLPSTETHDAPHKDCQCGYWGFRTREEVEKLAISADAIPVIALGRISMWGRVYEQEKGFRSEFAYPYEITVYGEDAEKHARAIREAYACDAVGLPIPEEWAKQRKARAEAIAQATEKHNAMLREMSHQMTNQIFYGTPGRKKKGVLKGILGI